MLHSSRRILSSLCLALTLGAAACSSRELDEGPPDRDPQWNGTLPVFGDDLDGQEIVFEAVRIHNDTGSIVSDLRQGKLTLDAWQRAARPWTHTDDEFVYHEQAWSKPLEGGSVEHGYRVVRTPNRNRVTRQPLSGKPHLGPYIEEAMKGKDPLPVSIRLVFPDWNVPLVPASDFLGEEDRARGMDERAAGLEARQNEFADRAEPVVEAIEAFDGCKVQGLDWGSGWIGATVTPQALAELATRSDIFAIDTAFGAVEDAQAQNGSAEDLAQPSPGAMWLGEMRMAQRMDADCYTTFGHNGEVSNAFRHSKGDVVVGVNEIGTYEDEGCYMADGPGCTSFSRVKAKYECSGTTPGNRCGSPVSNLTDSDQPVAVLGCTWGASGDSFCKAQNVDWIGGHCECTAGFDVNGQCLAGTPNGRCNCISEVDGRCARHATQVTSIILADYSAGQADGYAVGDDLCIANNAANCGGANIHNHATKRRGTGMAPEAGLVFWGNQARCAGSTQNCPTSPCSGDPCMEDSLANAFTLATTQDVDVMNNSWIWRETATDCNPMATRAFMMGDENAYDDGIFVVHGSGNEGLLTSCELRSPATLPKVFAVSGTPTATGQCAVDYTKCNVTGAAGRRGGLTINSPAGTPRANAVSGIALVAPTGIRMTTAELGAQGEIADGNPPLNFGGSSAAAAVISGLAADVKGLYLARRETWINNPGRLFTVMLAMGDRHYTNSSASTTVQRSTGGHVDYGFGRVKLRRFGAAGTGIADGAAGATWNATVTATTTAPISGVPFPTPLPSDTRLVKCVLLQEEDMSSKTEPVVGNIDLEVEIQPATGGNTCPGTSTPDFELADTSFDTKSMVAITDANTTLGGKCARVLATPVYLHNGTSTFHMMCYASSVPDDGRLGDSDSDGVADVDEKVAGSCPDAIATECQGSCTQVSQPTPIPAGCGNALCAPAGVAAEAGENCLTCPNDCGACTKKQDSDCDNLLDDEELNALTDPKIADSDGDGTNDGLDTQRAATAFTGSPLCTTRVNQDWVSAGPDAVLGTADDLVGLTGPLSTASNRRPTATWATAQDVSVKICTTWNCASGTQVTTLTGAAPTPTVDLPRGLNFAHGFVKKDDEVACAAPSSRWQFFVNPQATASAGTEHMCAVTSAGGMKCWGSNGQGRLGNGVVGGESASPVQVSGLTSGIDSASAGSMHSCALTTGNLLKCWGNNRYGELGINSTISTSTPADVTSLSDVKAVNIGNSHTCAIVGGTGTAKCWGYNFNGAVGDGTTINRSLPANVMVGGSPLSNVVAIDGGGYNTCALLSNGSVKCWGDNSYGQIGNGTSAWESKVLSPVDVIGLGGVVQISTTDSYTCALTGRGAVKCWGRNVNGQLGDGTGVDKPQPVDVVGLASGVASIAAGSYGRHMCAVLHSGAMKCWGNNATGQLADGTTTQRYAPVDVPGLPAGGAPWLVVAGSGYTCAPRSTGLMCWGHNGLGQLGVGSLAPTQITSPVGVGCVGSGFGPQVHFPEVSSSSQEYGAVLSPDLLTLYFSSNRPGGLGGLDLHAAVRTSITQPFAPPTNLTALNSSADDNGPSLSSDGMTLYFSSARSGPNRLFVATRSSTSGAFGAPTQLGGGFLTLGENLHPDISRDDRTMYFQSASSGGLGGQDVWVSTRADKASPWSNPVNVTALNTTSSDSAPSIDALGLTIWLASTRREAANDLYYATRVNPTAPFSTPALEPAGSTIGVGEHGVDISDDGLTLVMSVHKTGGLGNTDIYMSSRSCVP